MSKQLHAKRCHFAAARRAFTLIELSIGLTILSLMAAGALTVGGVVVEQQQFVGSNTRVLEAKQALEEYFKVNGRLPCPASRSIALGSAGFGEENCGAVSAPGFYDGGAMRVGALPVRTLGLRDSVMSDEYGNRIQYAVSEDFTVTTSVPAALGQITLQDNQNNNITTAGTNNGAVFFVFSTGPDGKGGYRYQSGAGPTTCSGGMDEQNCDNANNIFRDTRFNNGTGAAYFFDDMIAWSPKYLLTNSSSSTAASGSNGQVQFNSSGFLAGAANFYWDSANNRVGIGTATPVTALQVNGNGPSGENLRLGSTGAEGGQMTLMDATGAGGWEMDVIGSGASSTFRIFRDKSDPVTALHIGANGNVGIGATTPADRLHVNGNIQIGQRSGAMAADGWGPALFFGGNTTENSDAIYMQRHNYGSDGSNLYLFLGDNSTGDDHFIIQAGGNNRFLFRNDGLFNQAGVYYQYGATPTMYFMDTDHRSSMIHVNSNQFYVLRGAGVNNGSWATYNGWWPLQINLENNDIWLGGNSNFYGSINMCQADQNGCFLRLSNDAYFQDNQTNFIDFYSNTGGGMRFYSPVIVHGNSGWSGQTSMQIHAPGGALQTDWPGGWGGGLATFDVVGASTYMSQNWIRSDRRYKRDIHPLKSEDMLDAIMKLKPMSYYYKEAQSAKGKQFGFIAQDVREVMPNLITGRETKTERLGLSYDGLIAPLVSSVQTLKKENDALKLRVEAVEKLLKDKGLEIPETSVSPKPDGYAGFDYRGIALMLGGALVGVLMHAGLRRRA